MNKIAHVGIAVKDLDAALALFRDALGLHVEYRRVVPDQGVEIVGLPVGESEIELLRPLSETSGVAKFLEKRGEGIHHICFEVDDVEAALRNLESRGYELIDKTPRIGSDGRRLAFVHPKGTHGVLIEFYEKKPLADSH
ncbi:MAG: methylmalonyl-CoA epimerase [Anaerolineae bacterium]|nr:methylmalonyl-CoA epimerase [Anaerolineae bacterium]